ncbi:D-alanyl-D-alanine carboxypeptidase/D-alanyl-D-alanine endopeptidase [Ureibacillus chungkukjangi]|uniref:D-alanyl-D-alanine carboxypeptidase/D-alanyl-D-alanine-endopeptidase (Penicillin-binding protein 4) n=1 Tax=Ureibacillus chungkukjangi TaxID=1202712 RepID=A0A318TXD4_9BACL|nr:D-alanyl-D-alanine carboxypeptidase/D-alanyl-D-alanine-endopeptidase [Ureibacillus chungkukjangi]MCM3387947.1 D-alanyl-D-alanine carboxypeptidase/D-alanyl-D-alanine-endopeptidase [Ureibacillus chungkukjangi]PYF04299.1 D-alanyl-D-alanine carboxypeptidase/D-alanyl-D-alanine-endopeptidase (penicillin-binding protein 4) [Ureibacillus chungkukjangi]
MKTRLILSIVILFLIAGPLQIVQATTDIENTIQTQLGNQNISVSLRDVDSGELIYMKNGDVAMKPASTLKLLTASAALEMLGPDYRFQTKLYIDGEVEGKVLNGDIYVKGGGDPTLQKKDFTFMADILMFYGIQQINGNLYGDESLFLGEQLTPGIAKDDESYYFAARTSALSMSPDNDYDAGTIIINVNAASNVGGRPTFSAEPSLSGMIINNLAVTVNKGQKNSIEILREHRTNRITITGNIPLNTSFKDWVTLNDPTINTLHAIRESFEASGLAFADTMKIDRGIVPKGANSIYTKYSLPLKSLMYPFLKLSNNSMADIFIKTMGREFNGKGDTIEGLAALKEHGISIGLNMENWSFEDGSGMSHANKVTANELSLLLTKIDESPSFKFLHSSLPIGGQTDRIIGGSLKNRFTQENYKNRVIAKTGHISGVYTLAGYVKANSGRTFAFTIMTQNQTSVRLNAIDEVVKKIILQY